MILANGPTKRIVELNRGPHIHENLIYDPVALQDTKKNTNFSTNGSRTISI